MFSTTDTIVAIATPPGHGGIGVVRIAGPEARAIVARLTGRTTPLRPRHATLCTVFDRSSGRPVKVDAAVVTAFAAPKSYTGDDVVEIAAHGSPVILQRIVELALEAGARLAEPGEFTLRAYLNGRIDLVQAEAVADLVEAVTPLQARAAVDQLEGTLTTAIAGIDASLFDLAARLEASLDFPDEGFHFITRDDARTELEAIGLRLDVLARDGRCGRVIREGALVAIAGRPNAGKSRLFNALVGADRAIVAALPGTTRDVLSERVAIGGVPITLLDTAGIRDACDAIEVEGVRRAREAHAVARVVLVVLDGSAPLTAADTALLAERTDTRVIVASKCDLPAAWTPACLPEGIGGVVAVSAVTGQGVDALRDRIAAELTGAAEPARDTPAITNVRHLGLVDEARASVGRAMNVVADGATEELVLAELAAARTALEAIVGRRAPDDLLRHIFGRFCIGK